MFEAVILMIPFVLFWTGHDLAATIAAVVAVGLSIPGMLVMHNAPFVMTSRKIMNTMLEVAQIKPGERMYDLGCGEGRLVIAAAKQGAIATGYELSVPTYIVGKMRTLFVRNASVQYRNFWTQDYSDANVIFCYLLDSTMAVFEQRIWPRLTPGTRVISHQFVMKDVQPDLKKDGVLVYIKR